MGFRIDEQLAAFVSGGHSMLLATRNAALVPDATRLSGLRVAGDDLIHVMLPRATGVRALANLRDNGDVAVNIGQASTFRAAQLKGRYIACETATPDDLELCREQLERFTDDVARGHGQRRQKVRNLWLFDCWRISIQIVAAFVQTPGPGAGRRLEST